MLDDNPVAGALAAVFGLAIGIWSLWATWVAFTGGTVPILGWELDGGFGTGLVWLFVLTPLFEGIALVLATIVAAPISMLFARKR